MTNLSKQYNLSQIYTNYKLWSAAVHILDGAQIASGHTIAGHRSKTSLKTYSEKHESKKKVCGISLLKVHLAVISEQANSFEGKD